MGAVSTSHAADAVANGKASNKSAGDRPAKPLDSRSKPELYNIARGLNINGRSTMTKVDLIDAIRMAR